MFSNYFFIPANKPKLLNKSEEIEGIDYRIFDFEDSVLGADIDSSINLLRSIVRRKTDWVRIPLEGNIFTKILRSTINMGYKNFVIPKFKGSKELDFYIEKILDLDKYAKLILLIEHPGALLDLEKILTKYTDYIYGVGLGSHDFSLMTGIKNDMSLMRNIRINLIVLAKAYDIEAIDVASMNISDESTFEDEIVDGFNCGYRSKFLIHPFQLRILKSFPFYKRDEVKKYSEILNYYKNNIEGQDALFSYEGNVYEKMHIKQFKEIVNWGESFYETDRKIL